MEVGKWGCQRCYLIKTAACDVCLWTLSEFSYQSLGGKGYFSCKCKNRAWIVFYCPFLPSTISPEQGCSIINLRSDWKIYTAIHDPLVYCWRGFQYFPDSFPRDISISSTGLPIDS